MSGLGDHVVAVERRQRNRRHVVDVQARGEVVEVVADLLELLSVPVDQVHLVDREHDVPDAEQRRQERVPAGLLEQTVAGVDQDDRQLRGRGTGHHVAGVLNVAGRVGDDELALGRGEVAVGDVDRDALLAFGAQAVGHQRQVGVVVTAFLGGALDRGQLVFHDGLGVEEQPTDEGGLAVVDGTGGGDPQQCRSGPRIGRGRGPRGGTSHQK